MEVMISLSVFALVTVMFASSLMLGKSASKINGQYAQAISLCQHKIDQLRAVGYGRLTYAELNDAGIVDGNPTTSPYSFVLSDQVASYLPKIDKNTPPIATLAITNHTDSRVKIATVTVTWKASPNRSTRSTVTMTAYIANAD